MARISLEELIAVLKEHPNYVEKWFLGVPPEQALYISFGEGGANSVADSDTLEAVSGHELVVDKNRSGRVQGIEIM